VHQIVAEVWRGGVVESVHHGSVVGLSAAGDGVDGFTVGSPEQVTFPRSSAKPMQALGMLRAGLDLDGELLALACASHSGEEFHIDGVRRILAGAGLTEADLRCTPGRPIGEKAHEAHLAAGLPPTPLYMNCSGKHAAMLATCVRNGWSTEDYLEPTHPLQLRIRDTVAELAGEPVAVTTVDGCGAPLFGFGLTGLARAFRTIATAPAGSPEHRIATAMHTYPEWVGGTGRDVTALMRGLSGAVAKDGAERVHALGLPDGRAVALKIADGSSRARAVVMVAALARLGVEVSTLSDLAEAPVLGHGKPVGAIRPALPRQS
jgi:L-asparaginase II